MVILLSTIAALAGTAGVLAGATGLPLGVSAACGCGAEGNEPIGGSASPPLEPVGPGKPFTFGAGVKSRKLILKNPEGTIRRQFLNGENEVPGKLTTNEGGNFALSKVGGGCDESIPLNGGESCEIEITSAAAGKKGEYNLKYGTPANELTFQFELKS